jgi:hypothetical protein
MSGGDGEYCRRQGEEDLRNVHLQEFYLPRAITGNAPTGFLVPSELSSRILIAVTIVYSSERCHLEPVQTNSEPIRTMTAEELAEEQKLIRRLQMMMNMVIQVIAQDATLTVDEAAQMIGDSRKAALAMFPGKELAYDLIWRPRFQRLMRERFRIQ